jgi:hypothetical protein
MCILREEFPNHYVNDTLKIKVFRQRELQGTLRITNEFNDSVQNQIVSFEEWSTRKTSLFIFVMFT